MFSLNYFTFVNCGKIRGIRKIDFKNRKYMRSRKQSYTVALKTLPGSKADFLKEFKNHMHCRSKGSGLKIFGLTEDTKNKEYLMVFQYANSGNLHKFIESNFNERTWLIKLQQLVYISYDLVRIHKAGYIHGDFHSGNILHNKSISNKMQTYISDLGLSRKKEDIPEKSIYGVMPYIAPEVLMGEKLTPAADIYGLGIIITEMSSGKRAFDGYQFNCDLAIMICGGLRPEFAPKTPIYYIKLAMQCMDFDPKKRPTAKEVNLKLNQWRIILESEDLTDNKQIEIKKELLAANDIIKSMPVNLPKHQNFIYTSKLINTKNIKTAYYDSKLAELTIPE